MNADNPGRGLVFYTIDNLIFDALKDYIEKKSLGKHRSANVAA